MQGQRTLVQVYPTADIRNLSLRRHKTCCMSSKPLMTYTQQVLNPACDSEVNYLKSKQRLKEGNDANVLTTRMHPYNPLSQIKACNFPATRSSPPLSTRPDCCRPQRRLNTSYSMFRSAAALWACGSRQWTWTGSRYAAYTDLGGKSASLRVPLNESSTGR